jgi:hypothetical protein
MFTNRNGCGSREKAGRKFRGIALAALVIILAPSALALQIESILDVNDVLANDLVPKGHPEVSYFVDPTGGNFIPTAPYTTRPGHGRVYPGYGGQIFDIESLYTWTDSTNLYISYLLGTPSSDKVSVYWSPAFRTGDIGIDTDGDGLYEYAIDQDLGLITVDNTKPNGGWSPVRYSQHNASGPDEVESDAIISTDDSIYVAYERWAVDPGFGEYRNKYNTLSHEKVMYGSERWVFEAAIPLSLFAGASDLTRIHLTHTCGNDGLDGDIPTPELEIPEPAALALVAVGLLGLARRR